MDRPSCVHAIALLTSHPLPRLRLALTQIKPFEAGSPADTVEQDTFNNGVAVGGAAVALGAIGLGLTALLNVGGSAPGTGNGRAGARGQTAGKCRMGGNLVTSRGVVLKRMHTSRRLLPSWVLSLRRRVAGI
jgi:hypothetical protein